MIILDDGAAAHSQLCFLLIHSLGHVHLSMLVTLEASRRLVFATFFFGKANGMDVLKFYAAWAC